ncbi:efflux RND transporter periplasmic adaptor subunit [Pseudodesulfovibrio portus]|uniref:Hemolysin D n=1 Tax=Pseudodesulfovibrio portus TaxID=231439 RepID=A0ABN6RWF1_9BACT|nr:efflux RND transporter periplasmic adaptor subunit [Pseudodesulfovibrio portus]BDQ34048.1 hemolysin D [Pseudodesulfovibrio portus]
MKRDSVIAMALAVLALAVLAGCKEEMTKADPIRPVRVYEVADSTENATRTFPGKVKATREASLAFRISGQIVRLDVKEGDYVEKGQLIAMLDQRDYQAAVADLRAKLAGARSVLKEARLNIERNRQLLEQSIIAQSAFDTAQSNFETSRSEVQSMEQSLRRAELNLQYTRLEAPFSGYIARKIPSNHEYVQAKEPIVELADTSALDVVIDVPESVWIGAFQTKTIDLASIHARFESMPGVLIPVRVKEYQTNANAETQTYKVTLTMDNPADLGIQPGMTAEIVGSLSPDQTQNAVVIPFSSVTGDDGGDKYVWVLDKENTVSRREIEVGRIVNDMFRVENGVAVGDVIVTAGVNYLREGQKVKILNGRIGGRE